MQLGVTKMQRYHLIGLFNQNEHNIYNEQT